MEKFLISSGNLLCLAALTAELCAGGTITFSSLPGDGVVPFTSLQTVGWGYSIQNTTDGYALPIALANSGVLYGSLVDIFDYPVIDPGTTIFQDYSFNAPGGFGSSLGLFEYPDPGGVPVGLHQTGTFTLTFQLYDSNPDLNFNAAPIGSPVDVMVGFDLVAAEATAVPEPGSLEMVGMALALAAILYRWRASRTRVADHVPRPLDL